MSKLILIVDDAEINRDILSSIFEEKYETICAADGEEAIEILLERGEEILAMFLDIVMPKKNGIEVLKYMAAKHLIEKIPVIVVTGEATAESDLSAYEYGAADVIYKPYEAKVVMCRTENLIELYQKRNRMEEELNLRTRQLKASQKKLANNNEFLINALGSVVEFRSNESGEHIQRVKNITKVILKNIQGFYPEYHLTDEQISMISQAAALHDVGKIAIPDHILNKPGKLTNTEFEEMKKHSIYGCEILEKFKQDENEFYKYCYEICRWHHEKYDGKGYPDGLIGEEIPIWSQVVAIADCFDALVSKRVYKDSYSFNKAYDMINDGKCGQFSKKVFECFGKAKPKLMQLVETGY